MAESKRKGFGVFFVNIFKRIAKFFRDEKAELKKVVWPTMPQLINNTGAVIAAVLIIGVVIWVLDYGFSIGISELLKVKDMIS